MRDPQVHLGVLHPDRGQRDGDVRGQRLPLLRGGELVRDRRDPVVRPGVGIGQQDAVIEVPDAQPGLGSAGPPSPRARPDSFPERGFAGCPALSSRGPGPRPARGQRGVGQPGLRVQRGRGFRRSVHTRPVHSRGQQVIPGHADDGTAAAPGHGLGLKHVLGAPPAHAVDHGHGPGGEVVVPVRGQPLLGVGQRGGRLRAGRGDQHELVGQREHPGEPGRRRIDHGQRVAFGQQAGEPLVVTAFEHSGVVARDDVQAPRGPAPAASRAWSGRGHLRVGCPAGEQRGYRGSWLDARGERGVAGVEVEHGDRHRAGGGQHVPGHQGDHGLPRTAGAAEHDDPARAVQRQPGPLPVQRRRVPLPGPLALAAGDHLDPAPPARVVQAAGTAQGPLDRWRRPVAGVRLNEQRRHLGRQRPPGCDGRTRHRSRLGRGPDRGPQARLGRGGGSGIRFG